MMPQVDAISSSFSFFVKPLNHGALFSRFCSVPLAFLDSFEFPADKVSALGSTEISVGWAGVFGAVLDVVDAMVMSSGTLKLLFVWRGKIGQRQIANIEYRGDIDVVNWSWSYKTSMYRLKKGLLGWQCCWGCCQGQNRKRFQSRRWVRRCPLLSSQPILRISSITVWSRNFNFAKSSTMSPDPTQPPRLSMLLIQSLSTYPSENVHILIRCIRTSCMVSHLVYSSLVSNVDSVVGMV